jgi:uncharacterized protein YndB with AHSA1/START domain
MPRDLTTSASISIDAPVGTVWEAITTPELIERWFFGVHTETDWTEGSPIVHRGEYRGRPYEDRGTILAIEPPRRLVHTHWSPVSGLEDRSEHYQLVTWELTERDGGTEVVVGEENLPSDEATATSEEGWRAALQALKELLEYGRP